MKPRAYKPASRKLGRASAIRACLATSLAFAVTAPAMADYVLPIPLPFPPIIQRSGAVLWCYEYGCRSSPYLPPPVIPVRPRVITPPMLPVPRAPAAPVAAPVPPPVVPLDPPPLAEVPPGPPIAAAPPPAPVRPSPKAKFQRDPEQVDIESDIKVFCETHQDEAMCIKLDHYLRKHGMK